MSALACALRYAAAGLRLFPVNARKEPLVAHWKEDASCNPAAIEAWCSKRAHCDFGWALPADVVVIDVDRKGGKDGFKDFKDRAGCNARDVPTPQASTPSGGLHTFFAASKAYKNAVAIAGTGIDVRSLGGYVVLPGRNNGREWLRELIGADGAMVQLLPAPAWLGVALRKASSPRAPLILAPPAALVSSSSDPSVQKEAHAALTRACARIATAPQGEQDSTRHAQCFYIGGYVGRGDISYAEAYAALLEAARAMPVYRAGDPWRGTEARVARSISFGMERPLALSETEQLVRRFHARAGKSPAKVAAPVTLVGAQIWQKRSP
jgi:hypothetical protein